MADAEITRMPAKREMKTIQKAKRAYVMSMRFGIRNNAILCLSSNVH